MNASNLREGGEKEKGGCMLYGMPQVWYLNSLCYGTVCRKRAMEEDASPGCLRR